MQLIIFFFYIHKLRNYLAVPDDLPDNLLYMFLLSRVGDSHKGPLNN
jgi:hypothetical protein